MKNLTSAYSAVLSLYNAGQYNEAAAQMKKKIEANFQAEDISDKFFFLGKCFYLTGNYKNGLDAYKCALVSIFDEDIAAAYQEKGIAALAKEKKAETLFQQYYQSIIEERTADLPDSLYEIFNDLANHMGHMAIDGHDDNSAGDEEVIEKYSASLQTGTTEQNWYLAPYNMKCIGVGIQLICDLLDEYVDKPTGLTVYFERVGQDLVR